MKHFTTICFASASFFLFAQRSLKDTDTSLDYRQRFFSQGRLIATNSYLAIPAAGASSPEQIRHGLWKEYFDKAWNPCDSAGHRYYRLGEYDAGEVTGKVYYFTKNGNLVRTAYRYPEIGRSFFNGIRSIRYHRDRITWIEYRRFDDDTLPGLYINLTAYYPDGTLKSYSLSDDYNHEHQSKTYTREGFCNYEIRISRNESISIKRKRKGRKEIIRTRENGVPVRITKFDGREIRRRVSRRSYCAR